MQNVNIALFLASNEKQLYVSLPDPLTRQLVWDTFSQMQVGSRNFVWFQQSENVVQCYLRLSEGGLFAGEFLKPAGSF